MNESQIGDGISTLDGDLDAMSEIPEGAGSLIWGFITVGLVSLCFAGAQVLAEVTR